jgi:hypothetical protein
LELGVVREMETELFDEKADAAIVIADKDVHTLEAEVRSRLRGGSGNRGHVEIIRRAHRAGKKITQKPGVRGNAQLKEKLIAR